MLSIKNLTAYNADRVKVLDDLNFDLSGGEILGVAGVAGSGQKELCEAMAGLYQVEEGIINYRDEDLIGKNTKRYY